MSLSAPLIGLGGLLRSGKDAFADYLVDEHGFVKLGMSDALHEAMLAIDPIVEAHGNVYDSTAEGYRYSQLVTAVGYVEAKTDPEVRRLLQQLGTEVGRNMVGENVWVNIMGRKIYDHRAAGHPVVVTGIRFPNEVQMVSDLSGRALWLERPGVQAPSTGTASHASENSVSATDFDAVVLNDGSLGELHAKADEIARRYRQGSA